MSSKARVHSHRKPSDTMSRMRMWMEGSKLESERDSGFSDASSEYLSAQDQTDSDGKAQGTRPGAQAVMGAPYSGLSPMIFMNNVLLKQPSDTPTSPKPWGFQPTIEVLPQPQVVFLQPVMSAESASLQRTAPVKRRRSKKYLPILKSYPKIAPHPCSSDQGSSSSSEQRSSASGHRVRRQGHKRQSCTAAPSALPVSPSRATRAASTENSPPLPGAVANGSSALSGKKQAGPLDNSLECALSASPEPKPPSLQPEVGAFAPCTWAMEHTGGLPESDLNGEGLSDDCDNKRKRFCNTYNILSQSGLLDITLRTKELIRQNRNSQSQLEQLRLQAALFLEAVRSGNPEVWTRLQLAMLEEGPEAMEEETERALDCLA